MSCKNVCRICKNLIFSESVLYNPTTNTLDITIPEAEYARCRKVCIIVTQAIPGSTPINALVNIIVGQSRFPLQRCDCSNISACEIKTRTKYSTCVITDTVGGAFRMLGKTSPCCPDNLETLPFTPTTTGGGA